MIVRGLPRGHRRVTDDGLPRDLRQAVRAEVHARWVVLAQRSVALVGVGRARRAVDERSAGACRHESAGRLGVRLEDLLPVRVLRLAAEPRRRVEDMGDPRRGAARGPLLRRRPRSGSTPARSRRARSSSPWQRASPNTRVALGQRAGNREADPPGRAGDEHVPALRSRLVGRSRRGHDGRRIPRNPRCPSSSADTLAGPTAAEARQLPRIPSPSCCSPLARASANCSSHSRISSLPVSSAHRRGMAGKA